MLPKEAQVQDEIFLYFNAEGLGTAFAMALTTIAADAGRLASAVSESGCATKVL